MKVAVCFSGQIRTALQTSDNLLRYFGDVKPDIFIHTWDTDDDKMTKQKSPITEDTINQLKSIYNPKVIVVDNFNDISKKESLDRTFSLYYSFMRSVDIKTQYELDNGFQYDYVVKLRMDLIFKTHRKFELDLQYFPYREQNGIWIENPSTNISRDEVWIDDVYYIGTSENMNVMSKYYFFLKKNTNGTYIQNTYNSMIAYLFDNNIKIFNLERNENGGITHKEYLLTGYTIYREKHLHLCPLKDFDEIHLNK